MSEPLSLLDEARAAAGLFSLRFPCTSRLLTRLADALEEGDIVTPLLLRVPEAAKALGVGRTFLYRLIDQGAIEVVRPGPHSVRVPYAALEAYVQQLRETA